MVPVYPVRDKKIRRQETGDSLKPYHENTKAGKLENNSIPNVKAQSPNECQNQNYQKLNCRNSGTMEDWNKKGSRRGPQGARVD